MSSTESLNEIAGPREIVSSRVFDVSRDALFEAFSDARQLSRFWGPNGFTNSFDEFDFRPGGTWRFVMRGPDGTEYPNLCRFAEIEKPSRIVFQHLEPMHRFTMTMTFAEVGDKTRLSWRMYFDVPESEEVRAFIALANEQNFDRTAAHLNANAR